MTAAPHHHTMNRKAAALSVALSLFLVLLKSYAWFTTDSLSLLSSLLDSSLDVVVSTFNMLAIAYAAKPADADHGFGHDAIEDIVGLVQAAFIGASGLFLIYEAVHRFIAPQEVLSPATGISILLISLACTLIIVLYQKHVLKQTKSLILETDSLHYLSDFLVSASIILSLILASQPGWGIVDPIMAVAIALYILHSSYRIGIRAFNNLMKRELPDHEREALIAILHADPRVLGFHALRTTRAGNKCFIQFHLELDENLPLKQAHEITVSVRNKMLERIGDADILIHEDPKAA